MTDRLPGQIDPPQATRAAREHHARRTEHTLLATDDAMTWAEEFCRIFEGKLIEPAAGGDGVHPDSLNEGTMVTWFANAMQVAVNQYERRKLHEKGELTEAEAFIKRWDEDHPQDAVDDDGDPTQEIVLDEAVTLEEQFLEGFKDGRP